jgi:uncharacterized protein YdeI (YjbR/CyaY-like superfamily)
VRWLLLFSSRTSEEFQSKIKSKFPCLGLDIAFHNSHVAEETWERLTPSRRKEIFWYLNSVKHPETLERNTKKVIAMLEGKKRPRNRPAGIRLSTVDNSNERRVA